MPKRARGHFAPWRCCVPIAALLTLSSCLVVVSTGPSALVGGNIVFVAVDGHGGVVASLHVTVADLAGDWRQDGMTARDGSFRCDVRSGITRVRAVVTAPPASTDGPSSCPPRDPDVAARDRRALECERPSRGSRQRARLTERPQQTFRQPSSSKRDGSASSSEESEIVACDSASGSKSFMTM